MRNSSTEGAVDGALSEPSVLLNPFRPGGRIPIYQMVVGASMPAC